MSTCIRAGISYKRHAYKDEQSLAGVVKVCKRCKHIKGGPFESGDQESEATGVLDTATVEAGSLAEILDPRGLDVSTPVCDLPS